MGKDQRCRVDGGPFGRSDLAWRLAAVEVPYGIGQSRGTSMALSVANFGADGRSSGRLLAMGRLRLHKRVFKALREGWKQGYRARSEGTSVEAKEVDRPVVAAVHGEEAELVDGKLRSGLIETSEWGLEDGKEPS